MSPATTPALCAKVGVTQSMGRVACAARQQRVRGPELHPESRVGPPHQVATKAEARAKIGDWITNWYNAKRRHSWCGGISPDAYENAYYQDLRRLWPRRNVSCRHLRFRI